MLTFDVMKHSELKECAALAARSFYQYEYFSIWFPEEKRRKRFLDALIHCEFMANSKLDTVHFLTAKENDRIIAVAQLCAPGFQKPDDMTYILNGWFKAQFLGGTKAVNEWGEMEKEASAPCHALPGRNWYLSLLSVDPIMQGKRVGSRFLKECLIPFVEQNGGKTFSLFTNSEINRAFYHKNGFEEFDTKEFAHNGKTLGSWSFIYRI
jgi:GNAT superfamily N-acetyltransferase